MSWFASALGAVGQTAGSGVLGYWDGGWSTYSSGQSRTKDALRRGLETDMALQTWQATQLPKLQRQGLESAGYNPLLAVGSASPAVGGHVGASFQEPAGHSAGADPVGAYLEARQRMANVDLTKASADKIRSETGLNAWRPVHLSRSEAIGLGANALGALGLNVHSSGSQSFTLFYNPLSGQLQNPANGRHYIPGHANSAEDVREGDVAVEMLDWKIEKEQPKSKSSRHRPIGDFFDPGMMQFGW